MIFEYFSQAFAYCVPRQLIGYVFQSLGLNPEQASWFFASWQILLVVPHTNDKIQTNGFHFCDLFSESLNTSGWKLLIHVIYITMVGLEIGVLKFHPEYLFVYGFETNCCISTYFCVILSLCVGFVSYTFVVFSCYNL